MNFSQNHFDFSAEEKVLTSQFSFEKSLAETEEMQQSSTVKSKKFSFLWTVDNFKKYINRQYEFTSPIFLSNVSSGTSEWRMMIFPVNIYPDGIYLAFRLVILSKMDKSYSVMYTISFMDNSDKQHRLKTRDTVFRRRLDFDESPIISNIDLLKKGLFSNESLVIKCEFDLLECENMEETTCKLSGNSDNLISRSLEIPNSTNYQNKDTNIPSMMNDLSYVDVYKKSSDSEKNVNALIEKDGICSDVSNCKIKEALEILSSDLKQLYYNTNQHDVVIYTDDGKRTAHEIILTSRSDYFKKALLQKDKEIHISGIDTATLDAVLYYLYSGKLKQMAENSAMDLMKASKLLGLPCLEKMTTETFLSSRIVTHNVTKVFLVAKELNIESLKNSALKFMAENREEVMKTDQWNELMKKDPHSAGEVLLTMSYYQNKTFNNAGSY